VNAAKPLVCGLIYVSVHFVSPRSVYRVRARDARRRVMRGKHQNSSTRLKAVESPMINVFIMFCDRTVLGLRSNDFATYIYLAP
jgi:hypothetical protein